MVGRAQNDVADRIVGEFQETWQLGQRQVALTGLFDQLLEARQSLEQDIWRGIASEVRDATAYATGEDPLSERCVRKPRGYAGDAATLDLIYLHPSQRETIAAASSAGQSVFTCTTNRPASIAVRTRRQVLADAVDVFASRFEKPKVLSLACGHLREVELSRAARDHQLGTFYAVDQDADSLAEVQANYGAFGVVPVQLGVSDLLRGARPAEGLHLAYSAGLYDYLPQPVAVRTTTAMFDMLAPGGRLLIANFSPDLPDIGYMESCMDWWLIYRDEAEVAALFDGIDPALIEQTTVWTDRFGSVVYGEVVRKA